MTSFLLGINAAYQEPAACLLADGQVVAFAEEERFTRVRHGKTSRIDNPDALPERAIEWCLKHAGIGWGELTAVGYSLDPDRRRRCNLGLRHAHRIEPGAFGTPEGEEIFYRHALRVREKVARLAPQAAFHYLPHLSCHAASAFLPSPFEKAAVLVVDSIGEIGSTWLGAGRGHELVEFETVDYPRSIGFVWEKMAELLGFDRHDGPGRLMSFATLADPTPERGFDPVATLREVFREEHGGTFFVDEGAFRFRTSDFAGLEKRFGPRREKVVDRRRDASIAAALQTITEDVLVHLATRLHQRVSAALGEPVEDLCLAGPLVLNGLSAHALATRSPFKRIWIQPVAHDGGTALGAALLLQGAAGERPRMTHAFQGPGCTEDDMNAVLDWYRLPSKRPDNLAEEVAARLERGEIVAWFQGRQEVGPRALGHRSVLCDPSRFDSRGKVCARAKPREYFRCFGVSALPEALGTYFETVPSMEATEFMAVSLPLKERSLAQRIPAVVQERGSTGRLMTRVHALGPSADPAYKAVVQRFHALTGVPMVLNTSFNATEPLVTTAGEAVELFLRSQMEALVLGPFLIERPK